MILGKPSQGLRLQKWKVLLPAGYPRYTLSLVMEHEMTQCERAVRGTDGYTRE